MNIHETLLIIPYSTHFSQLSGESGGKRQHTVDVQSYTLLICVLCFVFFVLRVERDSPSLLEEPVLNAIAKKHNRSPGQVALRFQLQRGVVVLVKSFNQKRIKENFEVEARWHFSKVRNGCCAGDSLSCFSASALGHAFPGISPCVL